MLQEFRLCVVFTSKEIIDFLLHLLLRGLQITLNIILWLPGMHLVQEFDLERV